MALYFAVNTRPAFKRLVDCSPFSITMGVALVIKSGLYLNSIFCLRARRHLQLPKMDDMST